MPGKPPPPEEKDKEQEKEGEKPARESDTFNRMREYEVSVSLWPDDTSAEESQSSVSTPKERTAIDRIRTQEEATRTPRRK